MKFKSLFSLFIIIAFNLNARENIFNCSQIEPVFQLSFNNWTLTQNFNNQYDKIYCSWPSYNSAASKIYSFKKRSLIQTIEYQGLNRSDVNFIDQKYYLKANQPRGLLIL